MIHEASRMSPAEMRVLSDSARREHAIEIEWHRRVEKTRRDERSRRDWKHDTEHGRQQRQKADVPDAAHVLGRIDRAGGQIAEQTIELVHGREPDADHHAHAEKRPRLERERSELGVVTLSKPGNRGRCPIRGLGRTRP